MNNVNKFKKIVPFVDITKKNPSRHHSMDETYVAEDHKWTFYNRKMDFSKDLGLTGKYCYHPFNTITVDGLGDVYMCICQAWLPISVGKIWEFNSFEDIVNSPKALEIQGSIIDGSYKYCDHNTCSIIKEGELSKQIENQYHTVNYVNFAVDNSCNLTCPSCRKEFLFTTDDKEFDRKIKIIDHLIKLIEQHEYYLKFTLSGDGDPFASLIYRHLLYNLNPDPAPTYDKSNTNRWSKKDYETLSKTIKVGSNNLDPWQTHQLIEIEIITNGVLLKAHWHKLANIHSLIIRTKISFDAGTEEIYNITRKGGDWNKVLEGAKFLVNWKQKNNSNMVLTANFVVQTTNFKDMPAYVELCDKIGFDEINFQKITDWGTFQNFHEHAVWMETHPAHQDFLKILDHPSLNNKKINFTNLK